MDLKLGRCTQTVSIKNTYKEEYANIRILRNWNDSLYDYLNPNMRFSRRPQSNN